MKHAWTAGLVLCAVVGLLAAISVDSRAESPGAADETVLVQDPLDAAVTYDDALYGDAYEENVDDWADYAEEGRDYDDAHSVSYDAGLYDGDEGWGTPREWIEECLAALGEQAIALVDRLEPHFGTSSLASADAWTGVILFPVFYPMVDRGWLPAAESEPLAADAIEDPYDGYDGAVEPWNDVTDDSWSGDDEFEPEGEACPDVEPVDETNHPVWGDAFSGHIQTSWGGRTAMIGLPRELEPIR